MTLCDRAWSLEGLKKFWFKKKKKSSLKELGLYNLVWRNVASWEGVVLKSTNALTWLCLRNCGRRVKKQSSGWLHLHPLNCKTQVRWQESSECVKDTPAVVVTAVQLSAKTWDDFRNLECSCIIADNVKIGPGPFSLYKRQIKPSQMILCIIWKGF